MDVLKLIMLNNNGTIDEKFQLYILMGNWENHFPQP